MQQVQQLHVGGQVPSLSSSHLSAHAGGKNHDDRPLACRASTDTATIMTRRRTSENQGSRGSARGNRPSAGTYRTTVGWVHLTAAGWQDSE